MKTRLWMVVALFLTIAGCSDAGKTSVNDVVGADALCFCTVASDCDDGNPCTVGVCGSDCHCSYQSVADDTACAPETACLLPGTCQSGLCVSPGNVECNEQDGNPCTVPECNPDASGDEKVCAEVPIGDGEIISSYCAQQVCNNGVVTETLQTEAAIACETEDATIDPKGCIDQKACVDSEKDCVTINKDDSTVCSQGTDKCQGFACLEGECVQDNELDVICDPPSECKETACLACTEFKCDPKDGACKAHKVEGACDDGSSCTVDDLCGDFSNPMYGLCKGTAKGCDDGKVCTVDSCDDEDGHCINDPKDENCPGSNNPCVSQVFCDPFATEQADPNLDGCVVTYKPTGTPCNDGDMCTTGEACTDQGGTLLCTGQPVDADDNNPCTNDWCDAEDGVQHDEIPDCGDPCGGQGQCSPGQENSQSCGLCGTQTQICSAQCVWGVWSQCSNQGTCTVGQSQSIGCGGCGTQQQNCSNSCQWTNVGGCNDPCQCECGGGTCCSNGCNYDDYGTICGTCKQCNGSGSCVNVSNGTNCNGGTCQNGVCQECESGEEKDCDPNCGVFSDFGDGEIDCVNNEWDNVCMPTWCKDSQFGEVHYKTAPADHDWHCAFVEDFGIYLCVKVYLSWICVDYLEVDLMKSNNASGTDENGPWDNDIKVVLRNTNTGKTYTQSKVPCAGNTSEQGGCFFDVGGNQWLNTLGLDGTDSFEVDIYSPHTATEPVGKTGKVKVIECF
jgi:hypothetical protein